MSKQMETSTLGHKSSGVVLKDITKIFQQPDTGKDFVAVDHINLNIQDGEMVTLLGPSGCGKTTTLRMISGFEYPTSGSVFIGERDVAKIQALWQDGYDEGMERLDEVRSFLAGQ